MAQPPGPCAADFDVVYAELVRSAIALGMRLGDTDPDIARLAKAVEDLHALINNRRLAEREG